MKGIEEKKKSIRVKPNRKTEKRGSEDRKGRGVLLMQLQ